jgi:hypothetical protein
MLATDGKQTPVTSTGVFGRSARVLSARAAVSMSGSVGPCRLSPSPRRDRRCRQRRARASPGRRSSGAGRQPPGGVPAQSRKQDATGRRARSCSSPQARTLRVADGSVRSLLGALTEVGQLQAPKTSCVNPLGVLVARKCRAEPGCRPGGTSPGSPWRPPHADGAPRRGKCESPPGGSVGAKRHAPTAPAPPCG